MGDSQLVVFDQHKELQHHCNHSVLHGGKLCGDERVRQQQRQRSAEDRADAVLLFYLSMIITSVCHSQCFTFGVYSPLYDAGNNHTAAGSGLTINVKTLT